jgi:hypothetical protein
MSVTFARVLVFGLLCMAIPALALAQPPQPQDGFVAVGDSPVQESLPAAPLLIAAYIVVLAGFFAYVVSLSRRLGAVQRDVERLEADVTRRGRA